MFKPLVSLLIIIAALYFGLEYTEQHQIAEAKNKILNTTNPSECKELGGEVQPVCMSQVDACIVKYVDAGKQCNSNLECNGRCINVNDSNAEIGSKSVGQCESSNNPCGCWSLVENGEVVARLCAD